MENKLYAVQRLLDAAGALDNLGLREDALDVIKVATVVLISLKQHSNPLVEKTCKTLDSGYAQGGKCGNTSKES